MVPPPHPSSRILLIRRSDAWVWVLIVSSGGTTRRYTKVNSTITTSLNDHIDFEATGLQKVADTAFLQRVELFDMTTVLVIGANPATKACKLTHTVNTDGKHCFTSELVSTAARINFI